MMNTLVSTKPIPQGVHHVAYRCNDAKQTVEWYQKHLGMEFVGRDENTPVWTQHLALKVESMEALFSAKDKLISEGIEVLGPVNHTLFHSIYFFDPNGHRIELACDVATTKMQKALDAVKWEMLNEWAITKKAPQHARWIHDGTEPPDVDV